MGKIPIDIPGIDLDIERRISEFKERVITLIISAFSFVAALSWNDAIKTFIKEITPFEQNEWPYLFLNAIFVTAIATIAIWIVSRAKKEKK